MATHRRIKQQKTSIVCCTILLLLHFLLGAQCGVGKPVGRPWLKAILDIRGGSTNDDLEAVLEEMRQNHEKQCRETDYWSASSPSDIKREDHRPATDFNSYAMEDWVLPDFDDVFDHKKLLHVSKGAVFSEEECAEVVAMAEAYFAERGGWTQLPSGRYQIDGFWIKDVPPVKAWFDARLKTTLFPTLVALYPEFVDDVAHLCMDSAYVFKYNPETGGQSDIHTDSGCLTFTIALNPKEEYDGGGTWFENLGPQGTVVEMDVGQVTFRPGGVRHQGHAITRGRRYVIGGFMMHRGKVEVVRQLLVQGTARALAGDPEGARVTYADALKKQGETAMAEEQLEEGLALNPRNVEALYSLGLLKQEAGDLEAAAALFERVVAVDPLDQEAAWARAEVAARRGARWARAALNCGAAHGDAGDAAEEVRLYKLALEKDPGFYEALFSLGSAHANAGEFLKALPLFRRARAAAEPGSEEELRALTLLYKAAALHLQGQMRETGVALGPEETQAALQELMGEEHFWAVLERRGQR